MMKLELMQTVVATVDSEWRSPLADEILTRWVHDEATVYYWRASANFLFVFESAGERRALRFNHKRERSAEAIRTEVDYVLSLAEQGVAVAKPIPSQNEHYVESVPTKMGLFHAVVFGWLPGEQMELGDLSPVMVKQWGAALGRLHAATQRLRVEESLATGSVTWADHIAAINAALPADEIDARQLLTDVQNRLEQLPITRESFGLIHFDFELDNLLWHDGQVGIVDFDDCARYWFVVDIAFALRDLFKDNATAVDLENKTVQHFIRGYRRQKPMNEAELAHIPLFLQLHNLLTFVKLERALTTSEGKADVEWARTLRQKLLDKQTQYRAHFAAYVQDER